MTGVHPGGRIVVSSGERQLTVDRLIGPVTAIRNAPSPAATSSLAIAEHVADHL